MKIKSISKQALAVLLSLAVLASTLMLNTLSVFAGVNGVWDGTPAASLATKDGTDVNAGSADNPYLIGSPADLAYLGNLVATGGDTTGKYYKLTADIALNDTTNAGWKDSAPIEWTYGKSGGTFSGTLDGNGKVIKGIYIYSKEDKNTDSDKKTRYLGLFPKLGFNVTIKNLGIEDSYIESLLKADPEQSNQQNGNAGAFAGCIPNNNNVSVTFENCYVADTVTVIANERAGGFIGDGTIGYDRTNSLLTIKNCYSSANVALAQDHLGWASAASFIGQWYAAANLAMINCYSTQSGLDLAANYDRALTSDYVAAGITEDYIKELINNLFQNCYCTKNMGYGTGFTGSLLQAGSFSGVNALSAADMVGKGATATMANLFTGAGDGAWVALAGYTPQLKAFGKTDKAWDGKFYSVPALENPTSPNGETNPYLISCAAELAYVGEQAKNAQTAGKYYKLTQDIVLNNTEVDSGNWYDDTYNPIQWPYSGTGAAFAGTLDGDGHVIKGVYVNTTASVAGLFDTVDGATIKNLGIESSYYMSTNFYEDWNHYNSSIGAIAAKTYNSGKVNTFNNCYVIDTVLNGWEAGALVGTTQGSDTLNITDCYSSVSIGLPPERDDARNNMKGAFLGTGGGGATFTRCYSVDSYQYVGYIGNSPISTTGCYGLNSTSGVTVVSLDNMKGKGATTTMSGLFSEGENSAWVALVGETPKLKVFNPTENTEWDGESYSNPELLNPTSPNGETNPYLITCAAELAYLGNLVATGGNTTGVHYKLTADIALNDTTNAGWKDSAPKEWTYGKSGKGFYGTLDGAGHVIKGLYVSETSTQTSQATRYASLFSKMGGNGTIKNLGIEDSYLEGSLTWHNTSNEKDYAIGNAAAFVGALENNPNTKGSIENCYVADSVTVIANEHAGGIIADGTVPDGSEFKIINCYSAANISGTASYKGSVVGFWYGSKALKIKNVYATQSGMPICRIDSTTTDYAKNNAFENCYAITAQGSGFTGVTVVTAADMVGKGTTTTMANLFIGAGADAWVALVGKTPQLKVFNPTENTEWDGKFYSVPGLENPAELNSENNPYLITCAAELAYVGAQTASNATAGKYYKLTDDIALNNTVVESGNWYDETNNPIQWTYGASLYDNNPATFSGILDGDGHIIKGLYIDSSAVRYVGLFPRIAGSAAIKNLGVEDSYINNTYLRPEDSAVVGDTGVFAGVINNAADTNVTIENCYVADTVTVISNEYAGGFIGDGTVRAGCKVNIKNCYSSASLTSTQDKSKGAFVAFYYASHAGLNLKNCYSTQSGIQLVNGYWWPQSKSPSTEFDGLFENCYSLQNQRYVIEKDESNKDIYANFSSFKVITADKMMGNSAVSNMRELLAVTDAWYVMTDETPSLMAFADAAKKANLNTKGDLNVDGYVDILDLVCYAQVKNNTPVGKIHVSNEVITGTKFADHTTEALKKFILGESFEEMKLPEPLKITTDNVKLLGRSVTLSEGVSLDHSASTLEFTTTGTSSVYLTGEYTCTQEGDLYFTVYINGERQSKRVKFAAGKSKVLIANKLDTNQTTTIKLVRQTEEKYGSFTALSFDLGPDGALGEKPANKGTYIEFLGDSITCGLGSLHGFLSDDYLTIVDEGGNECNIDSGENFRCEDATNGYAYLAAEKLGADYSLLSYSGIGVSTGYFGNFQMKDYFKLASKSRNVEYTPTRTPDLVVINLGTNDVKDLKDDTSIENFKVAVKALIAQVRETYGENVKILWATGIMGEAGKDYAATAIAEIKNQNNLWHFTGLTEGRNGHSGHPNKVQAEKAAQDLYEFINTNNILTNN